MLAAISLNEDNAKDAFRHHPDMAEYLHTSDFEKIDKIAYQELQKGKHFSEAVLSAFSSYIDISNPYAVMLAIKKVGVKNLVDSFAYDNDAIETDFAHFEH